MNNLHMKCQHCGKEIENGSSFCIYCGAKVVPTITCPRCNTPIPKGDAFCMGCGWKVDEVEISRILQEKENEKIAREKESAARIAEMQAMEKAKKEEKALSLFKKASEEHNKKQYELALSTIIESLNINSTPESEFLKNQIIESLKTYFKDAISKAKNEKKTTLAGKYAKDAQKYFPNEEWVTSALEDNKRRTRKICIWIVSCFLLYFGIAILSDFINDEAVTENAAQVNDATSAVTQKQADQLASEELQNLTSIPQSEEPVMEAEETPVAEDAVDEEVVELTEYYKGLIDGKYPITVDLYIDLEKAKGSYYYDKYGSDNRLTLDGEWVANDEGGSNLVIKEYNAAGKLIGTFEVEGHSADMDYLEGTYTLLSKDKKMPFVLNLQQ